MLFNFTLLGWLRVRPHNSKEVMMTLLKVDAKAVMMLHREDGKAVMMLHREVAMMMLQGEGESCSHILIHAMMQMFCLHFTFYL